MAISATVKKQIIELAKEGLNFAEIGKKLLLDSTSVQRWVHSLNDPQSSSFNPVLYNEIIFKQSFAKNLVNKDLLEEVVQMVLEGYLPIEIAFYKGMVEEDVTLMLNKLNKSTHAFYDPELYVLVKTTLEENRAKPKMELFERLQNLELAGAELTKYTQTSLLKSYRQYFLAGHLIQDYLDQDMQVSDQYLATKYNLSLTQVRRYLLGREAKEYVYQIYGEKTMEKIRAYRAQTATQKSKSQFSFVANKPEQEDPVLQKVRRNLAFWNHFILTFRLNINEVATLLHCQDVDSLAKVLYRELDRTTPLFRALEYLFTTDQVFLMPDRLLKAQRYLLELQEAKRTDLERYTQLITQITDASYKSLLKRVRSDSRYVMTEEDWRIACMFRLKYALPYHDLPFSREALARHCPEEMKEQFVALDRYNSEKSKYYYVRKLERK